VFTCKAAFLDCGFWTNPKLKPKYTSLLIPTAVYIVACNFMNLLYWFCHFEKPPFSRQRQENFFLSKSIQMDRWVHVTPLSGYPGLSSEVKRSWPQADRSPASIAEVKTACTLPPLFTTLSWCASLNSRAFALIYQSVRDCPAIWSISGRYAKRYK